MNKPTRTVWNPSRLDAAAFAQADAVIEGQTALAETRLQLVEVKPHLLREVRRDPAAAETIPQTIQPGIHRQGGGHPGR